MPASPALNVDAVASTCWLNSFRQHAAACARHPERRPAEEAPLVVQQLPPEAGVGPHKWTLLQNHLVSLAQAEGLEPEGKRSAVTKWTCQWRDVQATPWPLVTPRLVHIDLIHVHAQHDATTRELMESHSFTLQHLHVGDLLRQNIIFFSSLSSGYYMMWNCWPTTSACIIQLSL